LAGILYGFRGTIVTYAQFNPVQSIFSVGWAVIGGLGFAIGAVFSAPNAIGGLGTRIMEDVISLGDWDAFVGGAILLLIIVTHQDGLAEVATRELRPLFRRLRLVGREPPPASLPDAVIEAVPPATLVVKELTVRFGGVTAVDDVSFTVEPGEVVGLIGPNGAGKTTIIDAVTGFVRPAAGELTLNHVRINRWSPTKRARQGLRRSFQSLELFEDISVEDNIRAGADQGSRISWVTDLVWPGTHALPPTAISAIHEFDLEPRLQDLPDALPYGRRRLVGIARAVASGPSVIMLDEPAAGLDETESGELASLIRRLADDRRMGVLLIEHDVGLVMSTCDRIIVLDFGAVIATGTPAEVRENQAVKEAYLGAPERQPDLAQPTRTEGVLR
jgi:sulfate-transporting ATPase